VSAAAKVDSVLTRAPEPQAFATNTGSELTSANGDDIETLAQKLEAAQRIVVDLRSPVGAIRMAVQMLSGPMRRVLDRLDPRDRILTRSVLDALETSTKQACDIVARTPTPVSSATVRPILEKVRTPLPTPIAMAPPAPRVSAPERSEIDLRDLLGHLEVLTVTRSSRPVLLAVDLDEAAKAPAMCGPELLQAMVHLVDNAVHASARAAPSAAPWTIELRAYADPREVLGDETDLVLEVRDRGDGMPEPIRQWVEGTRTLDKGPAESLGRGLRFVKEFAEQYSGTLEVRRVRDQTVVRIRLPTSQPPSLDPAKVNGTNGTARMRRRIGSY